MGSDWGNGLPIGHLDQSVVAELEDAIVADDVGRLDVSVDYFLVGGLVGVGGVGRGGVVEGIKTG